MSVAVAQKPADDTINVRELVRDIREAPRTATTTRRKHRRNIFRNPNAIAASPIRNTTPFLTENAIDRINDEGLPYVNAILMRDKTVRVVSRNKTFTPHSFAREMERVTQGKVIAQNLRRDGTVVVDLRCQ